MCVQVLTGVCTWPRTCVSISAHGCVRVQVLVLACSTRVALQALVHVGAHVPTWVCACQCLQSV